MKTEEELAAKRAAAAERKRRSRERMAAAGLTTLAVDVETPTVEALRAVADARGISMTEVVTELVRSLPRSGPVRRHLTQDVDRVDLRLEGVPQDVRDYLSGHGITIPVIGVGRGNLSAGGCVEWAVLHHSEIRTTDVRDDPEDDPIHSEHILYRHPVGGIEVEIRQSLIRDVLTAPHAAKYAYRAVLHAHATTHRKQSIEWRDLTVMRNEQAARDAFVQAIEPRSEPVREARMGRSIWSGADPDCAGAGSRVVEDTVFTPEQAAFWAAWEKEQAQHPVTVPPVAPDAFRGEAEAVVEMRQAQAAKRRSKAPEFVHDDEGTMMSAKDWIANGGERFWESEDDDSDPLVDRVLGPISVDPAEDPLIAYLRDTLGDILAPVAARE